MSMKNSNDTIGNRTRDLPACSAVPQPSAPSRAPVNHIYTDLKKMCLVPLSYVSGNIRGMCCYRHFDACTDNFSLHVAAYQHFVYA
jgi:hypothetical protein